MTVWFSLATKSDLRRLRRVVRAAERIIGTTLPSLQELFSSRVNKRAGKIPLDHSHPAQSFFELLHQNIIETKTVSSLGQSISWTLDKNYGTHTIYTLIHFNCTWYTCTCKTANCYIPVHTIVNLYIVIPPPRPFASVRFYPLAWSSGSDQRQISGCGIRWLLAGPDSLPLWLCRVCAFVLLRCFSCSHTVLPKEHSLGIIFFSSLSSCKCCIFLQFYLHFTTDYTCMIVYVTNNKEPYSLLTCSF